MSRINIEALAESMVARGYSAFASVLQSSFKEEIQPVSSDSSDLEDADEDVDTEALRDAVLREYEHRIDSLELVIHDQLEAGVGTDSGISETVRELEKRSDFCRNCLQILEELISTGRSTVATGCVDEMVSLLERLSFNLTLENFIGTIKQEITGLQILDVYLSAQNPELTKVLYDSLLEKAYIYVTCMPDFCSLLPVDLLRRLLDDDKLNIACEDDVLDLIKQREPQNPDELRELASCIRFPFLTCSTYDALIDNHSEILQCQEFELCKMSKDWLSQLPKKQLTRRRHYSSHLHILWHEDSVGVDEWEKMVVSCLKGSHREDILSSKITQELESVVEARGRCAVSGRNVLVGASSGTQIWAWLIDTSTSDSLAVPREKIPSPIIDDAEFVDAFDARDGEILFSWTDESDDAYHLGVIHMFDHDDLKCDKVPIPLIRGSCRSRVYRNFIVILTRSQLTLFDKASRTSLAFDSPAKARSNFLDLIVISAEDGRSRAYVYDFRTVLMEDSAELTSRDLLVVFDLERLEWEKDSWDLELDSVKTDLRCRAGPYNGISLFEYRGHAGVLAELTENGGVRFKIILIDDHDEWTETIADISAVTDGGLGVREVLGFIPIDLNPCLHETVFNRHCRENSASPQVYILQKLAE